MVIGTLLEHFIKELNGFEVFAVTDNCANALKIIKKNIPDLILIDIYGNTNFECLNAVSNMRALAPLAKIIVLTDIAQPYLLKQSKKVGVNSFCCKRICDDFAGIISRTMAGENIFPSAVSKVKIGKIYNTDFTEREYDVLCKLTFGKSNNKIACELGITPETVKAYVKSMLKKTDFHTRTELVAEAIANGIVIKG